MSAFDSDPPRFTEGTKLSWIRGLIWKFSSPGCAWLGADNSPPHLRTGESYTTTAPPSLLLSSLLRSVCFSDLWGKKTCRNKLEENPPGIFTNEEFHSCCRRWGLLWIKLVSRHFSYGSGQCIRYKISSSHSLKVLLFRWDEAQVVRLKQWSNRTSVSPWCSYARLE